MTPKMLQAYKANAHIVFPFYVTGFIVVRNIINIDNWYDFFDTRFFPFDETRASYKIYEDNETKELIAFVTIELNSFSNN